ncbi:MAG: FlgD immunoglobulin-like domain containing protein [candidate division KSB1 bacterium]|nr:FlgD immunoglobulin-like domain containing protein [candidate division KSB1 bacterium]
MICRNQANTNGALLTSSRSDAWFYNVTVTDHIDGRYLGGLIHLAADNTIKFANSILWTPEGDNIDIFMDEHNSIEFEYSNIRTTYLNQHWPVVGYPYEQNNIIWGPGNGSSAPLFTHADPFQYILQSGSPCIDAGNPGPAYNDEQDPENPGSAQWPARGGLRNDMGAYGGCDLQSVVPVELALFTAESAGSHVHLTWTTLSETNNYGFNIQRRTSDTPFQTIAFVKGQGTSTQPHHYSYQDSNLSPGMYEYRLKQIDADGSFTFSQITRISINTPQKFRLAQNYPNPFNTSTRFTYDIPCAAETRLFIYNLLGEQIRCLVNDSRQPGTYRVSWDGRDDAGTLVSSGCYYCRMQAAAFTAAVKLVLLR